MEEDTLVILRNTATQLIMGCNDEDLLDLVCKLLVESCAEDTDRSHNSKVYQGFQI